MALFRDEACGVAVESKVSIFVRQFAGVYQARLSLGTPDKHGRRQATGWQWITPPPHNVTFYEKLNEALAAHMLDSGGEVNALIIGRWFDDEEEILPVACWIDFATSEYAVEFRHIATRLHTEASLDAVV